MTQHLETGVNPARLVGQAHQLVSDALSTFRRPEAYSQLARFRVEQASIDWGTVWGSDDLGVSGALQPPAVPFPVLLRDIEQLARKIEALQVLMAGFATMAYSSDVERAEVFGMPPGKAAFRNISEYLRDSLKISLRSAKIRVKLAQELAPAPSLDGGHVPAARYADVAARFFASEIDASAADIVVDTINQVEKAAVEAKVLNSNLKQGRRS